MSELVPLRDVAEGSKIVLPSDQKMYWVHCGQVEGSIVLVPLSPFEKSLYVGHPDNVGLDWSTKVTICEDAPKMSEPNSVFIIVRNVPNESGGSEEINCYSEGFFTSAEAVGARVDALNEKNIANELEMLAVSSIEEYLEQNPGLDEDEVRDEIECAYGYVAFEKAQTT